MAWVLATLHSHSEISLSKTLFYFVLASTWSLIRYPSIQDSESPMVSDPTAQEEPDQDTLTRSLYSRPRTTRRIKQRIDTKMCVSKCRDRQPERLYPPTERATQPHTRAVPPSVNATLPTSSNAAQPHAACLFRPRRAPRPVLHGTRS
ncbi:hypothetical protein BT67DRAFT_444279 [Trichocladium antarcticum]|uniref:Uncharacterized protein n=1 Tax=Trichocladium antarcticum TaxID=1450529 RepID=A0AAN6UF65_9PEZI|nr:hypothetical protein BT67DRAFT_444279 [Trichocladium antarcticum]